MKALVWNGINELGVEQVPDPQILNSGDAIVKVKLSSVCGSDLHLLGGYIPAMWSPCGAAAGSGRWLPGRRCSWVLSASSPSTATQSVCR